MAADGSAAASTAMWRNDVTAADEQLRSEIETEFRDNPQVRESDITATVSGGVITLTGIVRSPDERASMLAAAHRASGMHPIHDMVAMRYSNEGNEIRRHVREAIRQSFHRTAHIDATNIGVSYEVAGTVRLTGRVHNSGARVQAENAAWATPGVKEVHNDIQVVSIDGPPATDFGQTE